jgi:hypothetical protein
MSVSLRMFDVQEATRKGMDSSSIATVGLVFDRLVDTGLNAPGHMGRLQCEKQPRPLGLWLHVRQDSGKHDR